jgi:hypothetical protein
MIKNLAKFLSLVILSLAPGAAHAFNPVRYVQVSTNTLSQQSGNINIQGATISTTTISSATITGLRVTTMTPTGIVGVTDGSNANTGNLGEYRSASAGTIAFAAAGTWKDMTSISLTSGDWIVYGIFSELSVAAALNGSIGISTSSGNSGTGLVAGISQIHFGVSSNATYSSTSILTRISISGNATVYLKGNLDNSSGSAVPGLQAWRVR